MNNSNNIDIDNIIKNIKDIDGSKKLFDLIQNITYLNNCNIFGYSIINMATWGSYDKTAMILISNIIARSRKRKTDVNTREMNNGETALHVACANGHWKIVKTLLEGGANTAIKNNYGQTARDLAVLHNHPKVVLLLDTFKKQTRFRIPPWTGPD